MSFKRLVAIFAIGIFVMSCSSENEDLLQSPGALSLSIEQDSSYRANSSLKAAVPTDDFTVQILKGTNVIKEYSRYASMPTMLELLAGDYEVKAFSTSSIPDASFIGPAYMGQTSFSIQPYKKTDLSITCMVANVKVDVAYTDLFKKVFSDYSIEVWSNSSDNHLLFEKDEERAGYFKPGYLDMTLHLTKAVGGRNITLPLSRMEKTLARDFIHLKLDVDPNTLNGDVKINITTDESTNDKNVGIDIPGDILPKEAPSFYVVNALPEGAIWEGDNTNYKVDVSAPNGLKDIVLELNSPDLFAVFGLTTIPLSSVSDEVRAKLNSYGITWTSSFANAKSAVVDFSNLFSRLLGGASSSVTHGVKITAVDVLNRQGAVVAQQEVKPYIFDLRAIAAGDVWSKSASLVVDVAAGDPQKAEVEVSYDNGNTWTKPTADKVVNGSEVQIKVDNLNSGVNLLVRPYMGVRKGTSKPITTETPLQLPNSDFEVWYSEKTDVNGKPITSNVNKVYWDKYFPWNANGSLKAWDTMNRKTTQIGGSPTLFLGLPTAPYVGCKYDANSGTIPTTDKHSGKYAALIRSVGWGYNSAANTAPEKTDAGLLYVGSYDGISQSPILGIAFTSRPTALTFYSKYQPKNADDKFIARVVVMDATGSVIAQNALNVEECGASSSYSMKRIELDYSNLSGGKAAKMYILFQSGTMLEKNSTDFSYPSFGNLSDGEFLGAQLFVDDVTLIYEK